MSAEQRTVEALLYQSAEDEEKLTVACRYDAGGLRVRQESDGALTRWCFEETPHVVEVRVAPTALEPLLDYLHLDDPDLLPALLAAAYGEFDASQRVRALLRRLGVPYEVDERPIVR